MPPLRRCATGVPEAAVLEAWRPGVGLRSSAAGSGGRAQRLEMAMGRLLDSALMIRTL